MGALRENRGSEEKKEKRERSKRFRISWKQNGLEVSTGVEKPTNEKRKKKKGAAEDN